MWHEIWHNTNKNNNTRLTVTQTKYMELGNEFVARNTLDDFFETFGTKLKDQTLKTNRDDTGYNRWVVNYDKLIVHFKADKQIVLDFMKDKMRNGDYMKVKIYLKEALIAGATNKNLKTGVINSAIADALDTPDDMFDRKYT